MALRWVYKSFDLLSPNELYDILYLRSKVFVVEQQCIYLDLDYNDSQAFHLMGFLPGETLAAYCRILPPGVTFPHASIGRVLTSPACRGMGFGKELMIRAIETTLHQFEVNVIQIGAQAYLRKFYSNLGFKEMGPEYLEDGIPHIPMIHLQLG